MAAAEEEEEVELTPEQIAAEEARIERELARQEKEEQEREEWARERRAEAELNGPSGVRQLSKKEQLELKNAKRGQGNRTAKTGPRARKPQGDEES